MSKQEQQEPQELPCMIFLAGPPGCGKHWSEDCSANRAAAMKLVDAMARYTLHLRAQGKSTRVLNNI